MLPYLPLCGHPVGKQSGGGNAVESEYRYLLSDLLPFGNGAVVGLEHGGEDQSAEHYESVALWYAAAGPSLVETDRVVVGDAASEAAHGYAPAGAAGSGAIYALSSRFHSVGVDHLANGTEIIAAENRTARLYTRAGEGSNFTLALRPDNNGVLLRRVLDLAETH